MVRMKETMDGFAMPPRARVRFARARARVAVAAARAGCAGARSAQRAELEKHIQRTTLPNGLDVIVVENHGVPLVTIEADVKNGSFTQGPEFEGLSHLYEHMFFKANAQYPNPDDFVARASELGAEFNGTTSEERVNYYLTVPADSVEGGMKFLAAALITPLFRKDELEREREVVIGEYDRNESSPFFQFTHGDGQGALVVGVESKEPARRARDHSEHDAGEDARDPAALLRPEQHGDHHHRRHRAREGVRARAIDLRRLEARRRSVRDRIRSADSAADARHGGDRRAADRLGGRDAAVAGPERDDRIAAATYAADVFSDVLNQPGSRFQRRLVDSGLFHSIGVNYYTLNQVGPITIEGETSPEKLKRRAGRAARRDREARRPRLLLGRRAETR